MFLEDNNKYLCSGCTACKNICPQNAIEMIEDEEGFKYPVINKDLCIECGLCFKSCPNVEKNSKNNIIEVYGAKNKNNEERATSRSGGVFVAMSDYILENNGIIYGAKLNNDFSVSHFRATNKEERFYLKGSKYVQSDMGDTIKKVKEDLLENKKVLFSGTACQVAGVLSAIPKNLQEKLYTCDLICHGVPSPKIYEQFLEYIEKTENKKIKEFIFRDKDFGWETHYETFIFEDGTKKSTQYFRNLFLSDNLLRPSCYKCNYANKNRPADITIADFWGIDEVNPQFNDNKGVSLVIINTAKGKEMFEKIKDNLLIINCSIEDCIKHTYTLSNPTPISEEREQFWKDYKNNDFNYIIEKYAK